MHIDDYDHNAPITLEEILHMLNFLFIVNPKNQVIHIDGDGHHAPISWCFTSVANHVVPIAAAMPLLQAHRLQPAQLDSIYGTAG